MLSTAAVTTSASPSLDRIGVCYEEMAAIAETQPAKVVLHFIFNFLFLLTFSSHVNHNIYNFHEYVTLYNCMLKSIK